MRGKGHISQLSPYLHQRPAECLLLSVEWKWLNKTWSVCLSSSIIYLKYGCFLQDASWVKWDWTCSVVVFTFVNSGWVKLFNEARGQWVCLCVCVFGREYSTCGINGESTDGSVTECSLLPLQINTQKTLNPSPHKFPSTRPFTLFIKLALHKLSSAITCCFSILPFIKVSDAFVPPLRLNRSIKT